MRRIGWLNKKPIYEGNENNIPKGVLHIDDLQGGKISYYKLDNEVLNNGDAKQAIQQLLTPFLHTAIICTYDFSNATWDPALCSGKLGAAYLLLYDRVIEGMLYYRQYTYITLIEQPTNIVFRNYYSELDPVNITVNNLEEYIKYMAKEGAADALNMLSTLLIPVDKSEYDAELEWWTNKVLYDKD